MSIYRSGLVYDEHFLAHDTGVESRSNDKYWFV